MSSNASLHFLKAAWPGGLTSGFGSWEDLGSNPGPHKYKLCDPGQVRPTPYTQTTVNSKQKRDQNIKAYPIKKKKSEENQVMVLFTTILAVAFITKKDRGNHQRQTRSF